MRNKYLVVLAVMFVCFNLYGQLDTVRYQWPVPPLTYSQSLSATFCEFRNTGSSDHFHNAIDIPEPDGNAVYPVMDGNVYYIADDQGSNSYVVVYTRINNQYKKITYLHIIPNPNLTTGQSVVTGQTVIGTIYPGQGHVHLTERAMVSNVNDYSYEINNIRGNGGITPYYDNYDPIITSSSLQFREQGSFNTLSASRLTGNVDIIARIEESNGNSSIYANNGSYKVGYRVWDESKTNVVYEQFPNGLTYKFDEKPDNSVVHRVFVESQATLSDPVYILTNGTGADNINSQHTVSDSWFDTSELEPGDYQLEIFTEDTRGNAVNKFFPITVGDFDIVPPDAPVLKGVANPTAGQSTKLIWNESPSNDYAGTKIYYSTDYQFQTYNEIAGPWNNDISIGNAEFATLDEIENGLSSIFAFYTTALDSSGNESVQSDAYARTVHSGTSPTQKVLIVDGFDNHGMGSSWGSSYHNFALEYFTFIVSAKSYLVETYANEMIEDGNVNLNDYDFVFWLLGDEDFEDETFSSAEQELVKAYLENGGNLFVSGSEVSKDLGTEHTGHTSADTDFLNNYLKAEYYNNGNSAMKNVSGNPGTLFDGIELSIGGVYNDNSPDDINPVNGGFKILEYDQYRNANEKRIAGVAYSGYFGNSTVKGSVVYISFPFEITSPFNDRLNFIKEVFNLFDRVVDVEDDNQIPMEYNLVQNYPNPFNPTTKISFTIPETAKVKITVYDILGNKVATLVNEEFSAGLHNYNWNAGNLASGVYFVNLSSGSFTKTIKSILLK